MRLKKFREKMSAEIHQQFENDFGELYNMDAFYQGHRPDPSQQNNPDTPAVINEQVQAQGRSSTSSGITNIEARPISTAPTALAAKTLKITSLQSQQISSSPPSIPIASIPEDANLASRNTPDTSSLSGLTGLASPAANIAKNTNPHFQRLSPAPAPDFKVSTLKNTNPASKQTSDTAS